MINFDFYAPTRILFGAGRETEVGKQICAFGGHKVLIIYGKKGGHIETSGLLDRIHQSLADAGLSFIDFPGAVPNPRLSHVKEGIRLGRENGVDFLLPIGGGSIIDTAKGIGYGIANDFEMEDLLYGKVKTDKNLPIGCVLTIAAAGSEMSSSMVLTIDEGLMKRSYGHDCSRPKFAIMNPELTYSLPAYQTASGAVDIMMHTMERYFTPTQTDNSLTDRIAEGLLVSVRDAAQVTVKEPENYDARQLLCGQAVFPTMDLREQAVFLILVPTRLSTSLAVCLMWPTVPVLLQSGEAGQDTFTTQIRQDLPSLAKKFSGFPIIKIQQMQQL